MTDAHDVAVMSAQWAVTLDNASLRGALAALATVTQAATESLRGLAGSFEALIKAAHMRRRRTHPGAWGERARKRRAARRAKASHAQIEQGRLRFRKRLKGFAHGGPIIRNRADRRAFARYLRSDRSGIVPQSGEAAKALLARVEACRAAT